MQNEKIQDICRRLMALREEEKVKNSGKDNDLKALTLQGATETSNIVLSDKMMRAMLGELLVHIPKVSDIISAV